MTLPSSFFPERKYNPGRKELTSIFTLFELIMNRHYSLPLDVYHADCFSDPPGIISEVQCYFAIGGFGYS